MASTPRSHAHVVALALGIGTALGCLLAWVDHTTHLYVHYVCAIVVVPITIVELGRALRGTEQARAPVVVTAVALAVALPLVDLPLLLAGLGLHGRSETAYSLAAENDGSPSSVVELTAPATLPHVESAQGLGQQCDVGKLPAQTALVSCSGTLSAWAQQESRWVRVHRWRGAWFEPRSRPPVVRAALGALAPGVVLEALERPPADSVAARVGGLLGILLLAAGMGVLLGRQRT